MNDMKKKTDFNRYFSAVYKFDILTCYKNEKISKKCQVGLL